ncbi:acylphosphatase [Chitinophaga sp.]|uniref:acylphosphatase n=1 Tax=Chitinophaga sp. TaxID=1869181 RepID=UPI0031E0EC84
MQKIHKVIIVKGKVQGVFFRTNTKRTADGLDIKGQVKNLPDGSVWIAAEGEEAPMEAFIAWCRQGPPLAKVTGITIEPGEVQDFRTFEVSHH